jgi:hypothetical protein
MLKARGMEYYESEYFSLWNGQKAAGEVDPDYMYFTDFLRRLVLHFHVRQTKFIFILRHPVDRAFSHYLMTCRRGLERLSFEEAIAREDERIGQDYLFNMHYIYLQRGLYCDHILRFLEIADRSQLLFLLTEDLEREPLSALRECFEFLNVSTEEYS